MKHLILIIGTLCVVLNTLIGLILSDYTTLNFLMANLSLIISIGIIYWVSFSKMVVGFKIGLTMLFFFTGIARCWCVVLMSSVWENNVCIIVAVSILLFEIACVAGTSFANKK